MWYRCRSVNAFVRQLKLEKNKMSYFNSPDHHRGTVAAVGETTCGVDPAVELILLVTYCFDKETAVE